jgi:hypothetical protein
MIPEDIQSLPASDDPRILEHQATDTVYAIKAGGSGIDAIEITNYLPKIDIGTVTGDFTPDLSLGAFFYGEVSGNLVIKQPEFEKTILSFAIMLTAKNADHVIQFGECSSNQEPHQITIPAGKSAGFMFLRADHYFAQWALIDNINL